MNAKTATTSKKNCCECECQLKKQNLANFPKNLTINNSKFVRQSCIDIAATGKKKREVENTILVQQPNVDIFLNPKKISNRTLLKDHISKKMKELFRNPTFQNRTDALFKLLWHSTIPCAPNHDIYNNGILRKCEWAGNTVNCSDLFKPIPTDSGMCCSFNFVSTLRSSNYSRLMDEMIMKNDKENNEHIKKVKVGKRNGLRIILDQHSNQKSPGTISKDYNAMQVFVGGSTEFPLLRDRGFLLEPGQEHFIELSGISITASQDIKQIIPSQRKCFFPSESSLLYYNEYTYTSCKFETRLLRATEKLNCTPWFLPTNPENHGYFCDPWEAVEFMKELENDVGEIENCLPDCKTTKYSKYMSSSNFR